MNLSPQPSRIPSVNVAVCGRFHYQNYIRQLDATGLLNQFFYADRLSRDGRALGIPVAHAVNGFFKEYAVQLHSRLLKTRWQIPAFMIYHDLWQRYVLRKWQRADILHVMLHGNTRLLMQRAKQEGAMIIGEPVNCHPDELRDLLNDEYERLRLKRRITQNALDERIIEETQQCDHLLMASQWLRDSFVKHGFPPERATVLPYGVDLQRFCPSQDSEITSGRANLAPDKFRVICVAQISARKGHVYLLEAWRKLNLPNAELLFIGRVDPDMESVLVRYQGLFKHIPYIPNQSLRHYYGASDIFALTSIEDGFGYVALEAMACELPIIVTVNCGSSEIIEEGVTGFRVPIRAVDRIAASIEILYQDRDRLHSMGLAAGKKVQEISWDNYTIRLCDYYNSLRAGHLAIDNTK